MVNLKELLEDLSDLAALAKRRNEPTISHEALRAELRLPPGRKRPG